MTRNRTVRSRERLMRPEDVADLFGYQPKTVIGWAKKGLLPYIRTPGGQYRFRPADVDDLLLVIGDESDEHALESTSNTKRAHLAIAAPDEPLTARPAQTGGEICASA